MVDEVVPAPWGSENVSCRGSPTTLSLPSAPARPGGTAPMTVRNTAGGKRWQHHGSQEQKPQYALPYRNVLWTISIPTTPGLGKTEATVHPTPAAGAGGSTRAATPRPGGSRPATTITRGSPRAALNIEDADCASRSIRLILLRV